MATETTAPFCEAAAEWDHDWSPAEEGAQVCGECGVLAVQPEPCPTAAEDDAAPCCIAVVTSGGRDHIPGCHA